MFIGVELPADASAAAAARALLREVIPGGPMRDDALVIVSELVANAWRHGDPPVHLAIEELPGSAHPTTLLIKVSNAQRPGSSSIPHVVAGGRPDGLGGRGLDLVAQLAREWGWELAGAGGADQPESGLASADRDGKAGTMTIWARVEATKPRYAGRAQAGS